MVDNNHCIDCQKPIEWWAERCEFHERIRLQMPDHAERVKHGLLLLDVDECREKFGTVAINFGRTPSATNFTKLMSSARELQDAYTCLNEFREVQRSKEREKENR